MNNFILGINFVCGLIIILILETGSFKINQLNFNYDSKEAKPFVKHTLSLLVVIILLQIIMKISLY